jgi:hypothetical protein
VAQGLVQIPLTATGNKVSMQNVSFRTNTKHLVIVLSLGSMYFSTATSGCDSYMLACE